MATLPLLVILLIVLIAFTYLCVPMVLPNRVYVARFAGGTQVALADLRFFRLLT